MINIKNGKIKIEEKVNEDLKLLDSLNQIILSKRDHVIKMPEKGACVTACLSGGMDE